MNKYCKYSKSSLFIYIVLNVITAILSVSIALIIELTIDIVSTGQMDDFTHDIHSPLLKEYDEIIFLVDGRIEMAGSYTDVFEHSEKFRNFLNKAG